MEWIVLKTVFDAFISGSRRVLGARTSKICSNINVSRHSAYHSNGFLILNVNMTETGFLTKTNSKLY